MGGSGCSGGGTKQVVDTLHKAAVTALHKPDVAKRLSDLGYVAVGDQPHELLMAMKSEIAKMAKLIRENNLTAD